MTQQLLQFLGRARPFFYLAIFFIFLAAALYHRLDAYEVSDEVPQETSEWFPPIPWPCDWIPHPRHFPSPKDNNDA